MKKSNQSPVKYSKEVQNCFYYPEYKLSPKPKTVIRELFVGMNISQGVAGDLYTGKITAISRNGNSITIDGDTEYTYRADSKDYSRKGRNFGSIMFGVSISRRDMDK